MGRGIGTGKGRLEQDGARGALLVEAARCWERRPGCSGGFSAGMVRRLCAAGLGDVVVALDGLLVVAAVHATPPLVLGPPGSALDTPDARLLAQVLESALDGLGLGDPAVDRLSFRLGARGGVLMRRGLARFGCPCASVCQTALPPAGAFMAAAE